MDGPKYHKSTAWLAPFIDSVKHLVPVNRISFVKSVKYPLHKREGIEGYCWSRDEGKTYIIGIMIYSQRMESGELFCRDGGKKALSLNPVGFTHRMAMNILTDLAHELAHIPYYFEDVDHSINHWKLEQKIATVFGKILQKCPTKDLAKKGPLLIGGK